MGAIVANANFERRRHQAPMAEMNVVPLVDVMLVLLVIFIVTAPLLTHAVKIELPQVSSTPNVARAENVQIAIREDGSVFIDGEATPVEAMPGQFAAMAARQPQPELHIHADRNARYEAIARVMALGARAGIVRIGFVSEPGALPVP